MKYRKAIFVVVYRKNPLEYLLLKRKLHWKGWEFTKGGVENCEQLIKSAKREAFEETGQKVLRVHKFNISGKYKYDSKTLKDKKRKGFIGQTYNLFSAEVSGKRKVKLDKQEHSGFRWASFKKAVKMLTWNDQKKCLKIVNKFLEKQN